MNTRYAIILAAGEGRRLRPFTDRMPKCMAEVCGRSILENALNLFADNGVQVTRIVVGHLAGVIRDRIGVSYRGMRIEYVENVEFANTNSMYSLYLGLQNVQEPAWLLEGDVFFEPGILALPVEKDISWFVDAFRKDLDGAYIRFDENKRALSLDIIRDLSLISGALGKSIGLLHLNDSGVVHFKRWLEHGVAEGQKNLYYDLVVGPHFAETHVEVVDVGGLKWFEIDTNTDLENARKLFE